MQEKYYLVVLRNENERDHLPWADALEHFKDRVEYDVIDLTRSNWLEEVRKRKADYFLAKPGGFTARFRQLYDERIMILDRELKCPIFPSPEEILIYENKRYLSYWLKANEIPHPGTNTFYYPGEAREFVNNTAFPVVAKINIGASGKGIHIIHNKKEAEKYIEQVFTSGIRSRTGPRLDKGHYMKRILAKLRNPAALKERIQTYRSIASDYQKDFILFQEYIPHMYEWRVVRIGDSFFAHKKILRDELASGSLIKAYENPPLPLLDFVREITEKYRFFSQAVDLFETPEGHYLVNEMQCIFGQSDPFQMKVDDKPGRYVYRNGQWVFEAGDFNRNQSFDLRVEFVLSQLAKTNA